MKRALLGLLLCAASVLPCFAAEQVLNHAAVVWVITKTVPEPPQDNPYLPGEKIIAPKGKMIKIRTVCAHEFVTKAEAQEFIAKMPADLKPHAHLIDEDQ